MQNLRPILSCISFLYTLLPFKRLLEKNSYRSLIIWKQRKGFKISSTWTHNKTRCRLNHRGAQKETLLSARHDFSQKLIQKHMDMKSTKLYDKIKIELGQFIKKAYLVVLLQIYNVLATSSPQHPFPMPPFASRTPPSPRT